MEMDWRRFEFERPRRCRCWPWLQLSSLYFSCKGTDGDLWSRACGAGQPMRCVEATMSHWLDVRSKKKTMKTGHVSIADSSGSGVLSDLYTQSVFTRPGECKYVKSRIRPHDFRHDAGSLRWHSRSYGPGRGLVPYRHRNRRAPGRDTFRLPTRPDAVFCPTKPDTASPPKFSPNPTPGRRDPLAYLPLHLHLLVPHPTVGPAKEDDVHSLPFRRTPPVKSRLRGRRSPLHPYVLSSAAL
ncbi:hypothetical protein MUK42_13079 [Musa troglodytarum]|uniref:Uncharacterized protein n=1 Tax=Musa troglodytarum TaxID=320322 RepID=A0A9E7HE76_9LILI|nr:hypothetical protein MUK42_13079 [Musa troglodytarum]